jgi:hypothetical protein
MSYIENMDKQTKLRTLCETRWTSRADALYTFKTSFPVVVHALERLQGIGDDTVGQYLASFTRFVFVIALVVSEHILQSTVFMSNIASAYFQRYRKVLINLIPIDTIHPKLIHRVVQLVTTQ